VEINDPYFRMSNRFYKVRCGFYKIRDRLIRTSAFVASSSALGFPLDISLGHNSLQTQEHTPMSDTPNAGALGRFSSQRKTTTVLRLFRGEDPQIVSGEPRVGRPPTS
jgi:hypothetical protein